MDDHIPSTIRKSLLALTTTLLVIGLSSQARAASAELVIARATGQVVSQAPCGPTEICQTTLVSGRATVLGKLTGVLDETIDIATGHYTGTATFDGQSGSVFTTYVGFVTPPDASGSVAFIENHTVVGGTGSFAGIAGRLAVTGTANALGQISIVGIGYVVR